VVHESRCPKCQFLYSRIGLPNHVDRTRCQVQQAFNEAQRRGLSLVYGGTTVAAVLRRVGLLEYHMTSFRNGGSHVPGGASVQPWAPYAAIQVVEDALKPWPSFYGPVELPPRRRVEYATYKLEKFLCRRTARRSESEK